MGLQNSVLLKKKINRWFILEDLGLKYPSSKSKKKTRYVLAQCECGNVKEVVWECVRSEKSKSCGCLNHEIITKMNTKHGQTFENARYRKIYNSWRGMKNRCKNISHVSYQYYGGKGIKVCDEWITNFGNFLKWSLSNGWEDGLVIDRIDSDENYSPDNCQWISGYVNSVRASNIRIANHTSYTRPVNMYDLNDRLLNRFSSVKEANNHLLSIGVTNNKNVSVHHCMRRKSKQGYGYKWEYA